jgi:DNA-binding transcriptional regulator YiaG
MFAQIMKIKKIREKYGDSVERFCLRLRASKPSVIYWEKGISEPHGAAKTLIEYAEQYDLSIEPEFTDDFAKLTPHEQLKSVMEQYGDDPMRFSVRIGACNAAVTKWLNGRNIGNMTKRLIQEMHIYPERFTKL